MDMHGSTEGGEATIGFPPDSGRPCHSKSDLTSKVHMAGQIQIPVISYATTARAARAPSEKIAALRRFWHFEI
jgi:hypothetical protein